jgi:hypothetical protein
VSFGPLEDRTLLAVLMVNSPLDNNIPGDGLVTLREAIIAANANSTTDLGQTGGGADTIQFDPIVFAIPRTISLAFGEMTITHELAIIGPGQSLLTIDAQRNSRVFKITVTSGDSRITDLSLIKGRVVGTHFANGGTIQMDGAGNLTLERVSITASSVVAGNNAFNTARGGAISVSVRPGALTIISSTISGNSVNAATSQGGGIETFARTVRILDSIISDNTASSGGGIHATYSNSQQYDIRPELTLTGTTITGNRSTHSGGGIVVNGGLIVGGTISENSATPSGTDGGGGGGIFANGRLTVRDTTIHANESTTSGGGIKAERGGVLESSTVRENRSQGRGGGIFGSDPMTLTSSTISGNVAAADGGGISASALLTIMHSTITNNHSTGGRAGGVHARFLDLRAFSSIIAGNTAVNGNPDLRSDDNAYTSHFSLIGDAQDTPLIESHIPDASGNLIGNSAGVGRIDPRLAPLADNGGPTRTHALLAGSPAIDANHFQPTPAPSHVYQLFSFEDANGGPSLTPLGGTLIVAGILHRYEFGANQGLNLASALANPAHYSIEIVFTWHALSGGWQKIIDFHNLTSNVGLYTATNGLHFWNGPFKPHLFEPSTFYRLMLTRDDVTDLVTAYIDGAQVWSFTDTAGDAVFDGPDQIIRFFQDDNVTGRLEAQSGTVDLIRLYDAALSPTQVAFLEDPIVMPAFDQRGAPFARVKEGDGVGGAQIDMGAYELQSVLPPAPILPGDFNNSNIVDAADYIVWRTTLGTSVQPFSGADGNGNGIVDQSDYDVWRANFGRSTPVGAGASMLAAALIDRVGDESTPVRMEQPIADSISPFIVPLHSLTDSVTGTARRMDRTRPTRRDVIAAAISHDDALVAWLTSLPAGTPRELAAAASNTRTGESDGSDFSDQLVYALDLAFATLGI